MTDGDTPGTTGALRKLHLRWLAPSPPLAVDDEPHWQPAADPAAGAPALSDSAVTPAPSTPPPVAATR